MRTTRSFEKKEAEKAEIHESPDLLTAFSFNAIACKRRNALPTYR